MTQTITVPERLEGVHFTIPFGASGDWVVERLAGTNSYRVTNLDDNWSSSWGSYNEESIRGNLERGNWRAVIVHKYHEVKFTVRSSPGVTYQLRKAETGEHYECHRPEWPSYLDYDLPSTTTTEQTTEQPITEEALAELRRKLEATEGQSSDLTDMRREIERLKRQRIELLEHAAKVAEDPDAHGIQTSRWCDEFDATMIRYGGYTRDEVNEARRKAAPETTVRVMFSRTVTIGGHADSIDRYAIMGAIEAAGEATIEYSDVDDWDVE